MRPCWMMMLAAACTGVGPGDSGKTGDTGAPVDDWQPVSYVDEGELCIEGSDTDVTIWVDPQECLSSSCSRAFMGSCEATVQGATITVTSDISWEENRGPNVACTDDCGSTAVSCALPALADGTYTVIFGSEQRELVVPIEETCQL